MLAHAVEKQPRLRKMIAERVAALANFVRINAFRVAFKSPIACSRRCFFRPATINGVRLVRRPTGMNRAAMLRIALVVMEGRYRAINGYLMKVGPAQTADLRIGVGKQSTLQQRVVGKVDPRHDMTGAEGDLLGLGKVIVGVAVEHHLAQRGDRHQLFGDQLGRVEDVELELMLVRLANDLYPQLPFRVIADFNRVP